MKSFKIIHIFWLKYSNITIFEEIDSNQVLSQKSERNVPQQPPNKYFLIFALDPFIPYSVHIILTSQPLNHALNLSFDINLPKKVNCKNSKNVPLVSLMCSLQITN